MYSLAVHLLKDMLLANFLVIMNEAFNSVQVFTWRQLSTHLEKYLGT